MLPTSRRPPTSRFLNRELSWLEFNRRVLSLARDAGQPLLERVRYAAIFANNLDEFFQVRVAGLKDQVAAGVATRTPDGRTARRQLQEIRERVEELAAIHEACFLDELVPELADAGIQIVHWQALDGADRKTLTEEFHERIFPILTPLAVDPSHPFPYISNLSLNLAVVARQPGTDATRFARLKVPSSLPRFLAVPGTARYVPVEQVLAANLDALFPGVDIVSSGAFRVTRNADLDLDEEEAEDLLAAVELELRRRRFNQSVRLEIAPGMDPEILALLLEELDLDDADVYVSRAPLGLAGSAMLTALDRPELLHTPLTPIPEPRFAEVDAEGGDLFAALRSGDVLVHHPYVSFRSSVETFLHRAASDPSVLAIKMTLYRTSGDTPIINALIRAAELGKQVVALVELKARFDEQANIEWARRLEKAGVHVVYGLVGLKTHTKTTLVIRQEEGRLRRYAHIGTGNYNSRTARIYEDLGLFTADEQIGNDLINLFNFLTGFGYETIYRKLLVAPQSLRAAITELIRGERAHGPGGRIVMKMNSLVDPDLIDELYAASGDGVQIDLIVRGICCLRPGVSGMSEHIRVRSLIGRYLEHSRVYLFANGGGPSVPVCYIGSADLMPRNLDRRIEALVPIDDPALRRQVEDVLAVNLEDDSLAWRLDADGDWWPVAEEHLAHHMDTHLRMHELWTARSHPVR
ncbi:MAG: polyphosphate kinase 1 [Acidimicrobiales bacterium]|nr:polyphosphate kinase 1 [Acidimicrobiales bacterium]